MQEPRYWTPPTGPLGRLCERSRDRVRLLDRDALTAACREQGASSVQPALTAALRGVDVAVIAEVKRRSPSQGWLNGQMLAADRARGYMLGGARALSVLTEPEEFGGSVADLVAARHSTGLPVLKKDFHVDPLQVWEAKAVGASALLLIARGLGPHLLADMMATARDAGIEAVVEVRREDELQWALDGGAAVIGVNCRDLESLEMEPEVHARVIPLVPVDRLVIAESGIATRTDVERLAALGADAILVGASLSRAESPVEAVSALTGVGRRQRGY